MAQGFAFMANSPTTTVTFRDTSTTTSSVDLMLDNVRVTAPGGPAITSQPQSVTVVAGGSATFSVAAPAMGRWRINGAQWHGDQRRDSEQLHDRERAGQGCGNVRRGGVECGRVGDERERRR